MSRFKVPLIATGIILAIAMITGIGLITWIHNQNISNRQKQARAEKLGGGLGMATVVAIAPFWLVTAARIGKERREAAKRKSQRRSDSE